MKAACVVDEQILRGLIESSLPALRTLDVSQWQQDDFMSIRTILEAMPTSLETFEFSAYADDITDFMSMDPKAMMPVLAQKSIKQLVIHVSEGGIEARSIEEYYWSRRVLRDMLGNQGIQIDQGTRWSYKLGDETPLDRLKALSSCCQSLRKSIVPFIFKKARLVIRSKQPIEELNSVSKSLLPSVTHLKVTDHGYLHDSLDIVMLLKGFTCLSDLAVFFLASSTCFEAWQPLARALGSETDLPRITDLSIDLSANVSHSILKAFIEAFSSLQTLKVNARRYSVYTLPAEIGINNPSLRALVLSGSIRMPCNCVTGSVLSLFRLEGLKHIVEAQMPSTAPFTPAHSNHLVMPQLQKLVLTEYASNDPEDYRKLAVYAPILNVLDLTGWWPDNKMKLSQRLSLLSNSVEEVMLTTRQYDIIEIGNLDRAALDGVLQGKSLRKLVITPLEVGLQKEEKEEYFYRKRLFRDAFAARSIEVEMK